MAPAPVADDTPSESTEVPAPDPLPAKDQAQAMEVDDYAARPSLPSPVSHEDDDLLSELPQSGATRSGVRFGPPLGFHSKRPEWGG